MKKILLLLFLLIPFLLDSAEDKDQWKLLTVEQSAIGKHVQYQQMYGGIPVFGSYARVSTDSSGRIIARSSTMVALHGKMEYPLDAQFAVSTARRFGNGNLIYNDGLRILPSDSKPKLVWQISIDSENVAFGSWILLVDAQNPRIIQRAIKTFFNFEGQGNVWTENPATTPNRVIQTLPNMDSSRTLSGKFVRVYNANTAFDVASPLHLSDYTRAKEESRVYNYAENDPKVEEAMGYFHINAVHDRWRSVGFRGLDRRLPIFVNVAGTDGGPGLDNSLYSRNRKFRKTGFLGFGAGDQFENAALDAEIVYHEYGHAVLDKLRPEFLDSTESVYPLSLHEAVGDISAAALSGNPKLFDFGFSSRDTHQYFGRKLNNKNRFPKSVIDKTFHLAEPHHTGLILGGSWWDLQKQIGAIPAQQLLFESFHLLPANPDFFDVRDAMIAADGALHSSANTAAIQKAFAKHGITGNNPGQTGQLDFLGLKTAVLPAGSGSYQLQNTFNRGEIVWVIAEYDASRLTPGYNFVPENFRIDGPSGSDYFVVPNIWQVFDGNHGGLNGLFLFEIHTGDGTTPGQYTVTTNGRLGGTQNVLSEKSLTFEVR